MAFLFDFMLFYIYHFIQLLSHSYHSLSSVVAAAVVWSDISGIIIIVSIHFVCYFHGIFAFGLCVKEGERKRERRRKHHLVNNNEIMGYHFRSSLFLSNELNAFGSFPLITLLFVIWFCYYCCCCCCSDDKYDMQTKKINGLLLLLWLLLLLFWECYCFIATANAIINAG